MQNESMTAWEAVEKLKIDISYSFEKRDWCACVTQPSVEIAFAPTPQEAVNALVAKIELRAANAEKRRKIEARLVAPLNKMHEQLKQAEAAISN